MRKLNTVVTEDLIVEPGFSKASTEFRDGYDEFQFPFTVSFECQGRYEVVIEGKKATVRRID